MINEEIKVSSSEQEDIGIRECRRRGRVDIINEEVKEWTYSPKQQEASAEPKNTKYDICFRTYEKKDKNSSPRMGCFRASGTVETLNVR